MKRILFVVTYLDTGGISRALQNFLLKYDQEKYIIDIFAISHQGVFSKEMLNCNLINKSLLLHLLISRFDILSWHEKVLSAGVKILNKLLKGKLQKWAFKFVVYKLENKNRYDAVIGFSEGVPTVFVSYMQCINKIAWIHCDYASYQSMNKIDESHIYQKMIHIVCVSDYTTQSFVNIYPTFKTKVTYIHNILDADLMRKQASEPLQIPFSAEYFNIVSVGRIDTVKRFSVIPKVAKYLWDNGRKVKWYIIGPKAVEAEFQLLMDNILKYNVTDSVILLGEKSNPYPYIVNANLLVNTSISEACPYVVNEAKILHVPVICTNFGSSYEFIENGINGFISPLENLPEIIDKIIENKVVYDTIKRGVSTFEYDNNLILSKIDSLIQ